MFYSNTIFKETKVFSSADTITLLVGLVNFGTTFIGLALITKFGRKTLMIVGNIGMLVCLAVVGVTLLAEANVVMVVFVLLFITFFEMSSGPITWLYMAEIMPDKSLTIATSLNWITCLVISIILPVIKKAIPPHHT